MGQNSGDYRNNSRPSRPFSLENSDSPKINPDYAVPSLIFDEYGEVRAIPQAGLPAAPPPPRQPATLWNNDETPSVPSLIFDEYGELKPSAVNAYKPAIPRPDYPPSPRPRYNPPAPVQPAPARQRVVINQAEPVAYTAPVQVAVPLRPNQAVLNPPKKVVKNGGLRKSTGLWITLGAVVAVLVIGLVLFLVLNRTASSTPSTNTPPVSLGDLFPFKVLTPGATTAGVATPAPTVNGPTGDLDTLYNQANAQLKNNRFKEAASTLEQLRDKQNQSGNIKHPDVPALLFRTYLELGDQLNRSSQFADFQQSMVNYQKAIDTAKTLDAKDRNQQEETALQARLDTGNLYIKAVTAYNQKELDAAIKIFSQLYARDQNFRDASNLYYDSLTRTGDGQFAENLLPEAYQTYARATRIKNVADTRYAQARATSIENQLRQAGKPIPAVPAP